MLLLRSITIHTTSAIAITITITVKQHLPGNASRASGPKASKVVRGKTAPSQYHTYQKIPRFKAISERKLNPITPVLCFVCILTTSLRRYKTAAAADGIHVVGTQRVLRDVPESQCPGLKKTDSCEEVSLKAARSVHFLLTQTHSRT